jgi:hypothetical protein
MPDTPPTFQANEPEAQRARKLKQLTDHAVDAFRFDGGGAAPDLSGGGFLVADGGAAS